MGLGGSVKPFPFVSKFLFHRKSWINLIKLEYHIYPKYSHLSTLFLILPCKKSILLPVNVCKIVG